MFDFLSGLPDWLTKLIQAGAIGSGSYAFGVWKTKRSLFKKSDKLVYKKLKDLLPEFNLIRQFYEELDLHNSFESDIFHSFHQAFDRANSDPELRFHDKVLVEEIKNILADSLEFVHKIGHDTFPVPHRNEQTIRRKKFGFDEDDMESGDVLNEMATKIFERYKVFVAKARERHLDVSVEQAD